MKFLEFTKREPARLRWAFIVLSVAFLTCFSALIALGSAAWYKERTERDTTASLIAADLLALRDASGEADAVLTALIQSRMAACLRPADASDLAEILGARDERLSVLWETLQSAAETGACTAAKLTEAIQNADAENGIGILQRASEPGKISASRALRVPRSSNPAVQAEAYFGVKYIFRTASDVAYCDNLCAKFDMSGQIAEFAVECMPGEVRLSEADCVRIAQRYAEEHFSRRGETAQVSARTADGICWVEFADPDGITKIGVRGDTGRICFLHRRAASSSNTQNPQNPPDVLQ